MLEQQAQLKAQNIAAVLTNHLEHMMIEGGKDAAHQALISLTTSPDILNAYLLKSDGTVTLGADSADTTKYFPVQQLQDVLGIQGEKYYAVEENERLVEYVFIPVNNKPACSACHRDNQSLRGYFAVKLAVDDVRSVAMQHRASNMLMTIITFASIGVITYFALSLLVIRPVGTLHSYIKKIEEKIKHLESGERTMFPLLPEPVANDEIADLIRNVNRLVQRLNEANATLIEMHHVQLEQAAKLASVGEMAASMAHEIKNPIAGVFGAVQIFESELQPGDPRKEIFSEMRVQLERVNHAVTDLLSYARPTPPVFEHVNLNDIVQRTCTMLSKQINDRQITVQMNLADDVGMIQADKKQLQQVIWNIMLNAVQAMEGPGILSLFSGKENGAVKVVIKDTGQGIPPECLHEVFKPFFTTKHKGTGLGMTITKRIIEQHGGTILIASEVAKGTSVSILLPQYQTGG